MAIIKHTSSRNAHYNQVQDYFQYKHHENPQTGMYEPILDQYGLMQKRDHYALACLDPYGKDANPDSWWAACLKTNMRFHKNCNKSDHKEHQYILSYPKEDRPLVSMEDLLAEGKAFVRENLQGYDALIAVHRDTDHDHIHIAINSARAAEREPQLWMLRNEDGTIRHSEYCAGGKHQDSPTFRRHINDWLMEYTRTHGLTVKDNNRLAEEHKQERYQEKNSALRQVFLNTSKKCSTLEALQAALLRENQIQLIIRGSTISLLPPNHRRAIRLETLKIDPQQIPPLRIVLADYTAKQEKNSSAKADAYGAP